MIRTVLVPVDFSLCSVQAAAHAFDLVRAIGGRVTLLYVADPDHPAVGAEARLRALARLSRRPAEVRLRPVGARDVAETILDIAAELPADLLVLGAHGLDQLNSRKLGQVARAVLVGARVPVQIVPEGLDPAAQSGHRWRQLADQR